MTSEEQGQERIETTCFRKTKQIQGNLKHHITYLFEKFCELGAI